MPGAAEWLWFREREQPEAVYFLDPCSAENAGDYESVFCARRLIDDGNHECGPAGGRLRKLINSEAVDQFFVGNAERSYYEELLAGGVKIYQYRAPVLLRLQNNKHR